VKWNLEKIIWHLKTSGIDPWGEIANEACGEIAEMEAENKHNFDEMLHWQKIALQRESDIHAIRIALDEMREACSRASMYVVGENDDLYAEIRTVIAKYPKNDKNKPLSPSPKEFDYNL
jgi:hypothetical protein